MDLKTLVKEIPHKRRSVDELVTYIKTKASKTSSNYSLLLGAGASVTSGISSGQELVEQWRKDIYIRENPDENYDKEQAKKYFSTNGGWYDASKEYSSLFEKKFDLPSQRRRFVEEQVDSAFPSIGYAYLVSLSCGENIYFDTIYTTNFDDLLNESFYQFSHVRPLLCAHDSSVSSLTINSSRPKIIKLHGDYLYDDIKSTLRETETLETNIKKKIIEFSKEYGLIVVGYSGGDRSIMDVLTHLLKSDDYFKNGIYWCLRKGDEINQELKKLLWKDRVYFVEIDGFDELMAELHSSTKGALSLDDSFGDSKKERIILNFTEDGYDLKKASSTISKDISAIERRQNNKAIGSLLAEMSRDSESNFDEDLSDDEFKNLLKIDSLIKHENYDDAESFLRKIILKNNDSEVNSRYTLRLIKVYYLQDKISQAIIECDGLMETDPYNINILFRRVSLEKTSKKRYQYLYSNEESFKYSYNFYNALIVELLSICEESGDVKSKIPELERFCEKSLTLNPSLSNDVWSLKCAVLKYKFSAIDIKLTKKEKEDELMELKSKIRKINPVSMRNIEVLGSDVFLNKNLDNFSCFFDKCKEIYDLSSQGKRVEITRELCLESVDLNEFTNDGNYKDMLKNVVGSKLITENDALDCVNILHFICKIDLDLDSNHARIYLDKAMKKVSSYKCIKLINGFLLDIYNDAELAHNFLNLNKEKIRLVEYYNEMSLVSIARNNYEDAKSNLKLAHEHGLSDSRYAINLTFLCLYFSQFREALDYSTSWLNKISAMEEKDILILNQQYANKMLGEKVDNSAINTVISHKNGSDKLMCGNILLGKESIAFNIFNNEVDKCRRSLYQYYRWPIVPDYFFDKYKGLFLGFDFRNGESVSCIENINKNVS